MITLARPELLTSDIIIRHGAHSPGGGTCARELVHLIVTGRHADDTPECLTISLSCLPLLNDGAWRDDAHRTSVLLPYLPRLMQCERDAEKDSLIAYRLADLSVRTIAAEAMEVAQLTEQAAKLRACAQVIDEISARDAARAARDAARAARDAARAARDAAGAAGSAAGAAAGAAWAAAWDAARAAAGAAGDAAWAAAWAAEIEKHERYTELILDVICNAYGV